MIPFKSEFAGANPSFRNIKCMGYANHASKKDRGIIKNFVSFLNLQSAMCKKYCLLYLLCSPTLCQRMCQRTGMLNLSKFWLAKTSGRLLLTRPRLFLLNSVSHIYLFSINWLLKDSFKSIIMVNSIIFSDSSPRLMYKYVFHLK